MSKTVIGVQIEEREKTAQAVQEVLTEYGYIIETRIGNHQASDEKHGRRGIIILDLVDNAGKDAKELEGELVGIDGVTVKKMEF